jgi:hypothetical protein
MKGKAVRFLIETGKRKSPKSWLSKMDGNEVLAIARELRSQGVPEIHIYDAENFTDVTETELERLVRTESHRH